MIKSIFKLISWVIRLSFLLIIFVAIFHTWVIKQALTFSMSYQLGADISIREVKMDWKNTGFEIRGLEISNPYKFSRGLLADIPLAIVSVDMPSLTQGHGLRLKTLGFNLRELTVINVPPKGLNILALKPFDKSETGKASPSRKAVERSVEKYAPRLTVDELIFSINDILYVDMSGPTMQQRRFDAGIRGATYYDVGGAEDIVLIVVNEALKKLGFGYLKSQFQKIQKQNAPAQEDRGNFLEKLLP